MLPWVSPSSMVDRWSKGNLLSTFLNGGGERKESASRKDEMLFMVSEIKKNKNF